MRRPTFVALLAVCLLAVAPATSAMAQEADDGTDQDLTIALVYGIRGDAFYVTMEKGAREKAAELGVELVADGPAEWNPAVQTPIVDAMIAKGVDALINVPNDPDAMILPLQRAFDAGMPIITNDQYIGDGDYVNGTVTFPLSYIASDNMEGGRIACQALIDGMGGSGKLYILATTAYVPSDVQRRDGCVEVVEANPDVELVGVDYTESSAAKATEQTQAMLQKEPDLGAVFGANLFSAQGAAAAVKNANLQGVVKVASFDAPEQAIDDLRNGVVDIVIAQQPALIGATSVQYAYDALTGAEDEDPAEGSDPVRHHHAGQRRHA